MGAVPHSAVIGRAPSLRAGNLNRPARLSNPPDPAGLPLAEPARAALAAAEEGSPAQQAFCSEISLDEGKAPEWIQLFPAGPQLAANDGRRWRLADPEAVARNSREQWGRLHLKLDWEHAHDLKAGTGEQVATAGWIKELAARDGLLMARVDWTDAGRASVESKEYKYVSPSFFHTRTIRRPDQMDGGDVKLVTGAALVGRPAFDMPALAGTQQEDSMLKKILEALGLAGDASEESAIAAIATLKSERDEAKSQAAAEPPSDKYVPRAMYDGALARASTAEGKLAEQAAAAQGAEIKRELDAAQEAGKITPAQRPWFESQCAREGGLGDVRELLAKTGPAIGPGGGSAAPPGGGSGASGFASQEEAAIASLFGRDAKFLDTHSPREVS